MTETISKIPVIVDSELAAAVDRAFIRTQTPLQQHPQFSEFVSYVNQQAAVMEEQ